MKSALQPLANHLLNKTLRALWVAIVLVLPVSSFPMLKHLTGASTVIPLALVLISLLALLWLVRYTLKGGSFPTESIPLLWIFWAIILSSVASFFIDIPPFRFLAPVTLLPEALLAFALGILVFITCVAWLSQDQQLLHLTLVSINLGGAMLLTWSLLQAYYIFFRDSDYPSVLYEIQRLISTNEVSLFTGRVTGLAYEPSWLAHQLNTIYLPFWLSATISRYSVFRRFGPFSVENILLLLGSLVLLASFSRVGWLSFGLVLVIVVILAVRKLVERLRQHRFLQVQARWQGLVSALITFALIILLGVLIVGLSSLALQLALRFEPRLAKIIELNPLKAANFYDFANRLIIGERVVYWRAGLEIFYKYPILGVGLGNSGFFFPQKMPAFGWWLTEVQNSLYRLSFIMNIKSLWMRLLAETGLVGFSFFISWFVLLFRSGFEARKSSDLMLRVLALAGLFMLVAFTLEGFSVDSFALPYFWFSAAMLVATAYLSRQEQIYR